MRNKNGQFAPGGPGGPGRPPKPDFRTAVEKFAAEENVEIDQAMWAVFKSMVKEAAGGNVQAARLVWDRWYGPSAQEVSMAITHPVQEGPARGSAEERDWLARAAEVIAEEQKRIDREEIDYGADIEGYTPPTES